MTWNELVVLVGMVVGAVVVSLAAAWVFRPRRKKAWHDRVNTIRIEYEDGSFIRYSGDRRAATFDWSKIKEIKEEK